MTKFGIKAASPSEVSDEKALAKLSVNFSKSSRIPIFVRNLRWASPTRASPVFLYIRVLLEISKIFEIFLQ